MRKKFAFNLIFLITANMLVKPYWIFGIDRVVQNKVGPAWYGTYFAVVNYSYLLSIILDFGINNFNNRAISRNNKRLGEYLVNLMLVKGGLSIIYFVLTLITAAAAGFDHTSVWMLTFLAINQILLSAILYFRSNIAALQYFKTDSIISTLDRLLGIIFCLVLLYVSPFKEQFNIMWFIYAQTAGLALTALISFVVLLGKSPIRFNIWKPKFTWLIILKSAPFAMLALLMGIYYRIDGVMIERMLPNGNSETGIYAASFRLLDAVNQFGYLFATLLLPLFASMIRKNQNMRQLVRFSSELMFVIAIVTAVDCYFYRDEIMHMLYRNSTPYWSLIFGWLMINFIPMSSVYVFGTLLTAKGSLKILNMIALGGMVLNIALNLYLIPHYGALGATIATLITQIVAAGAHIWAAHRQFAFDYEIKDLLKILVFSAACIVTLYAVKFLPLNWIIGLGVASVICCLFAVAINLVPLRELYGMLKPKPTT